MDANRAAAVGGGSKDNKKALDKRKKEVGAGNFGKQQPLP